MPNLMSVFDYYNPLTDERLDPPSGDMLYKDSRVPADLHHYVRQAKRLVGDLSLDQIKQNAKIVGNLCESGQLERAAHWQPLDQQDYLFSSEVESLRFKLSSTEDEVPLENWACYMGVLALAVAGDIFCTLWPPRKNSSAPEHSEADDKRLHELTTVIARATTYGEAFRDMLGAQEKRRQLGEETGNLAHAEKKQIIAEGVAWILALSPGHEFRTTTDAARHFLKKRLPQGFMQTIDSTTRTLVTKVHRHVKNTKKPRHK